MDQVTFVEPGRVELRGVDAPVLKADDQALVRPLAVASCDLDATIAAGRFPVQGPFALGHEGVGEVIDVGPSVRGVRPGQRVSIPFQVSCGSCDRCRRGLSARCTGNGAPHLGQFFGLGEGGRTWGGFLSDIVRVPFADHMLVPVPDDIAVESIASLSDNVADAYTRVAPGLERFPGAPVLVVGGSGSVGLYAVGVALALGAERVDFVPLSDGGVGRAQRLGATIVETGDAPGREPYPVTVDASSRPTGLLLALRSTEVGGMCSSTGFYVDSVTLDPLDLLNLYFTDVSFEIGLAHARGAIPPLLELVRSGRLRPEMVTATVLPWDQAPAAMATVRDKLVFVRDGIGR